MLSPVSPSTLPGPECHSQPSGGNSRTHSGRDAPTSFGAPATSAHKDVAQFLCSDASQNAPHTQQQFFNTGCFQQNPGATVTGLSNTPGTAGRGIINGPPTYRVDFTMTKNIRFGEHTRLQLRGEAFNVFNHTNFRSFVSTNVTSTSFGVIGATRDPRTIQLGAKFYF